MKTQCRIILLGVALLVSAMFLAFVFQRRNSTPKKADKGPGRLSPNDSAPMVKREKTVHSDADGSVVSNSFVEIHLTEDEIRRLAEVLGENVLTQRQESVGTERTHVILTGQEPIVFSSLALQTDPTLPREIRKALSMPLVADINSRIKWEDDRPIRIEETEKYIIFTWPFRHEGHVYGPDYERKLIIDRETFQVVSRLRGS